MNSDLEDLYQQVILDHSKRPRNFGEIPVGAVHVHGDNPSCGDEIHLHVKFAADGAVEDIKFTGQGCAISQASASLMTMKIKGKPRVEAEELAHAFQTLITTDATDSPRALGDLRLMNGVRKFPQRVKCAMLAWRAFEQALAQTPESEAEVSTEPK
ncbi:MAG: putative iron-sulfur cluster assembly protein [Chthoniobacteraceae bacterium]|nr:putative iron-sulfur cluster assembly protein [Chthoniobacteraceae bacterium]